MLQCVTVGIGRFGRIRVMRILFLLAEICAAVLLPCGFIAVSGFLNAITPAEAVRQGQPPVPIQWEAGVWNHGGYLPWFTIRRHPALFALSVAAMLIGGFGLNWFKNHGEFPRERHLPMPAIDKRVIEKRMHVRLWAFALTFLFSYGPLEWFFPSPWGWVAMTSAAVLAGAAMLLSGVFVRNGTDSK